MRMTKTRGILLVSVAIVAGSVLMSSLPNTLSGFIAEGLSARAHNRWYAEYAAGIDADRNNNFEIAEEHFLESYRLGAEQSVPPNADSHSSAYALGRFYQRRGDNARAADYFYIARGAAMMVYGEHSDEAAKATRRLVEVYRDLGAHEDEVRYARSEVAIRRASASTTPEQTIRALRNLGQALRKTGAFDEALEALEQAETLKAKLVDEDRYDLAMVQSACGLAAFEAGKVDQAREWFGRALPALESIESAQPVPPDTLRDFRVVYERLTGESHERD